MPSTTLYLGMPACGKSTLMRAHVDHLRREENAPFFFIVDHDDSWNLDGVAFYHSTAEWWRRPMPVAVFRGVNALDVAQLTIDVGWSVYVDDEVDGALSESWKENPIREIVKRGRHLRNRAGNVTAVAAMVATHRPSNLPTDMIGLFERAYIGKLMGGADAERVYREGWLRGTIYEIRDFLAAKEPGDFSVWPE